MTGVWECYPIFKNPGHYLGGNMPFFVLEKSESPEWNPEYWNGIGWTKDLSRAIRFSALKSAQTIAALIETDQIIMQGCVAGLSKYLPNSKTTLKVRVTERKNYV